MHPASIHLRRSPFLLFSFSLILLISFLYLSFRAQAHPPITPEQAIALALGDIEPVGENFRISDMGGDVLYDAGHSGVEWRASVAFNSTNNQYLVVWSGDDNLNGISDEEFEIFGQLVDGSTGEEIGNDFRISQMGPDNDPNFLAEAPSIAYNPEGNEYLVVWYGSTNANGLVSAEFEIYGQRIDAPTGLKIGPNFRVSDMGPDGTPAYDAYYPAIAYNSEDNQYLVIWYGDDNSGTLVDEEREIFGQLINATNGNEIGINDFRISDMGPDGNSSFDALVPNLSYNSIENEYYVVWYGDDNENGLVNGEFEIFGQRIDGLTGVEIGGDSRISDMGTDGNPNTVGIHPAITFNSTENKYLIVWNGDDATNGLVDDEYEIFGQQLSGSTGEEIGPNDFKISDMGDDGDLNFFGDWSYASYNSFANEYLITWHGNDNVDGILGTEIYAQRLTGTAANEIGQNDFRLSEMGDNETYTGEVAQGVFNPNSNEFLVIWRGDDNTNGLIDEEFEIFAQRLDATGTEIGADDFRVSDMGGDVTYDAYRSNSAYNSTDQLYLVVWYGDDNTNGHIDEEFEIFGQLVDAESGIEIGTDFLISDMGPDGDINFDAIQPNAVYNSNTNEFLVVWMGDDNISPLVDDEFEIFGQRLNASSGLEIGENDFRISNMGPDGDVQFGAGGRPDLIFNPDEDEYLVVWFGEGGSGGMVNDEREVFGQRLEGDTSAKIGTNFRISDMGGDGDINYIGDYPAVAYNSTNHEYLVVWHGDDNVNGLGDDEYEIFGQRLSASNGTEVGENDFRVSDMGDSSSIYGAFWSEVTYNSIANEYLIVWQGDDNENGLVDEEFEIFGQRINGLTGTEVGTNDFRISDMGTNGNINFDAFNPAVSFNMIENEYLIVWQGDDNLGGLVDEEFEIFGQRLDGENGAEIAPNDLRISHMGADAELIYDAVNANISINTISNEYLVVWNGDTNINGLVDEEFEVFGQRLQYLTPTPTPTNTPTPTPTPTNTPTPPPTGTPGPLYLPIALRPLPCLSPYTESEPNGPPQTEADGPLCLNQAYTAFPNDSWDYFTFTLDQSATLVIDITNHPLAEVNGVQVQLYYQAILPSNKVGDDINPPYQIEYTAPAGTYYLIVFTDTSKCGACEQLYTVQVSIP